MGNFFKMRDFKVYNPKAVGGDIRISSFGDTHISHLITAGKLNSVTRKVEDFNPDYVCIPGDLLDYQHILKEKEKFDMLKRWLSDMTSRPILISLGTHDTCVQVSNGDKLEWVYSEPYEFIKELEASVPNVHVLDNKNYQDDRVFVSGYTQPYECYYKGAADPKTIMQDDLASQDFRLTKELDVPAIALIHDPMYLTEEGIIKLLENYDYIFSGHMHNGVVPPILDELWRSNLGIMQPNKKLIAPNARGVIPVKVNGKIIYLVVNGGIVKIQETAPRILWPADYVFPSSIDNIIITNDDSFETPKIKSYYKF